MPLLNPPPDAAAKQELLAAALLIAAHNMAVSVYNICKGESLLLQVGTGAAI
jgi:hypothetical protein